MKDASPILPPDPCWTVYILRCADGTFYTGIARDLTQRIARHERGQGAKYTRGRGPFILVFAEPHPDKGSALRRERAIKALDRTEKERLAAAGPLFPLGGTRQ